MRVIRWPCNIEETRKCIDLSDGRGSVPLSSEEGTTNKFQGPWLKKMAQAEARLSYLCRIRSTAARREW